MISQELNLKVHSHTCRGALRATFGGDGTWTAYAGLRACQGRSATLVAGSRSGKGLEQESRAGAAARCNDLSGFEDSPGRLAASGAYGLHFDGLALHANGSLQCADS